MNPPEHGRFPEPQYTGSGADPDHIRLRWPWTPAADLVTARSQMRRVRSGATQPSTS